MELNIRVIDRKQLPGFHPYLLPGTVAALERSDKNVIAIGAVIGHSACGAVAVRLDGDDSVRLTDLFVDEAIRRRGVGTFLLAQILELLCGIKGLQEVTADYALQAEDLVAMDAVLTKHGFSSPVTVARSFRTVSEDYRGHPILGWSFTPRYRTPEGVVPFDRLPWETLEELEQAEDISMTLSWSELKSRAVPELSVALIRDGKVLAYQLAEESADGGFVLLSAVNREGAPSAAFIMLLQDLLNRCWYREGGDFPFYFSAINDPVEKLARRLMDGRCTEYEEHECYLLLDELAEEE